MSDDAKITAAEGGGETHKTPGIGLDQFLKTAAGQSKRMSEVDDSERRQDARPSPGIGLDCSFITSWTGILLIAAFVSSVLEVICSSFSPFVVLGGAFVTFTGTLGSVVCGIIFLLYLFRIVPSVPGPCGLVMLVYFCSGTVMGLLAYSISVAFTVAIHSMKELGVPAVCSAVFSGIAMIVHGVLAFLMFLKWQVLKHDFHRGECGNLVA